MCTNSMSLLYNYLDGFSLSSPLPSIVYVLVAAMKVIMQYTDSCITTMLTCVGVFVNQLFTMKNIIGFGY